MENPPSNYDAIKAAIKQIKENKSKLTWYVFDQYLDLLKEKYIKDKNALGAPDCIAFNDKKLREIFIELGEIRERSSGLLIGSSSFIEYDSVVMWVSDKFDFKNNEKKRNN